MRGWIEHGVNHGLWQYYFENGRLNMAGNIEGSSREGKWQFYYENGALKSEGNFDDDKKNGIWNYFYEDGTLKAQAFYKNDVGHYKEFYNEGALKAEGQNAYGKSDSIWSFYHENGNLQAQGPYANGMREGKWTFYHDNGSKASEGQYVNNERQDKWTFYHPNGAVSSEGALRDDKKEGYWKIFNKQGQFTGEGIFEQNDGKYTEYYEGGAVKAEGNIEDGKNHGVWWYYYEDGTREGECHFAHGSGQYIGYYRDGNIKMKGRIEDGVNVGVWELYNGDGSLAGYYQPYYENDNPVYKLVEKPPVERGNSTKPAYRYKNSKVRYFDPVINEYRGIIIGTNPLPMFLGNLPLSLEYYFQERLGYELQVRILREPFFASNSSIALNDTYQRGLDIALRQKFYHPEGRYGMFYFAHEVRYTMLDHYSNVLDSASQSVLPMTIQAHESKFEYSVLIGNRFISLYGERIRRSSVGFTIDGFIGFGIGYRLYEKRYGRNTAFDAVFGDLNQSNFSLVPRVGLTFGIIF